MEAIADIKNAFASKRLLIVSLEANLGSGKSTLLNRLSAADPAKLLGHTDVHVEVLHEPLDQIGTLLDLFYADKARWAFTLQMVFFLSRVSESIKRIGAALLNPEHLDKRIVFVIERSVYADMECFVKMLHASNLLSDLEYNAYIDRFDWSVVVPLTAIVHLQVLPEECFRRMRERGRAAEREVELPYLKALADQHDTWLASESYRGIPIVRCDGNAALDQVFDKLSVILKSVVER